MLERGRSGGSSPVPEPGKRVVFCAGWKGGSPRYRHAAFWARGPVRLELSSLEPVEVTITVDRHPILNVVKPSLLIAGHGWQLIGVDVNRADRGLRVSVQPRSGRSARRAASPGR
jgi:hypothetical protein